VRDLGVLFDSRLIVKKHIAKVAAVCFFHIRQLRHQIRRCVSQDVIIRLMLALKMPWLYYCNSLLAGLLQSTLEPLQSLQNATAQLVFDLCHHDHVLPYLMQLHWVKVCELRVQFKLCTLTLTLHMRAIHNKRSPSYLSDAVQTVVTMTILVAVFDHLPLRTTVCHAADIFKVRRVGLHVCRSH